MPILYSIMIKRLSFLNKRLHSPHNTRANNGGGFSLPEIIMGIVVFSILVGISVPIYSNYQTQLNQDKIDSALITAGSLIEREAIDNNGLYATYLPSEISDNSDFEDIIYTYNDDRTVWCLQTNKDPRRYISSTDPDTVSSVVCTQKNIATGSATP